MNVKLLTEHHLEFLSLTGGCRGSFKSTLVKMSNCWKSHAAAQITSCLSGCVIYNGDDLTTSQVGTGEHLNSEMWSWLLHTILITSTHAGVKEERNVAGKYCYMSSMKHWQPVHMLALKKSIMLLLSTVISLMLLVSSVTCQV